MNYERALIVDDEAGIRFTTRVAAKDKAGYREVDTTGSHEKATSLLRAHKYDLIWLDWSYLRTEQSTETEELAPETFEVVRQTQTNPKVVIYCADNSADQIAKKFTEKNEIRFLAKPANLTEIVDAMKQ